MYYPIPSVEADYMDAYFYGGTGEDCNPEISIGEALADLGMRIVSAKQACRGRGGEVTLDAIVEGRHVEILWCERSQRFRDGRTGRFVSKAYAEGLARTSGILDLPRWEAGDLCEHEGDVAIIASVIEDSGDGLGDGLVRLLIEGEDGTLREDWSLTSKLKSIQ